ncbi:MAG: hypothetical protein IPH12_01470 [Saprospirales bacterium]|jgi:hypothetical protein|nr:hypothetical protein [Saprospirales bacterium]MBK8923394.1 hypothetical protein [Saprospirales bacterium]
MQIDIGSHIEKLLFLHDTLTIPSFGGFSAARSAAAVDYAGGAIAPPSKTLAFSENLAVDDGILVDDLVKTHGISTDEAREAIRQFVEQMQVQLNQREIVTLPGVGRLYKNYVQKIQFLPDATNFHAASYGLPPLQFSPIGRSREIAEKQVPETAIPAAGASIAVAGTTTAKPAAPPVIPPLPAPPSFVPEPYATPRSSAARFGTGIGVGLLVCTIAFGIWWWKHNSAQQQEKAALETPQNAADNAGAPAPLPGVSGIVHLGEKDAKKDAPPETARPEQEDQDLNDEVEAAAEAKKVEILRRQNEAPPSSSPAPKAEGRQCILIVATLQDSNNADRLIAKLKGGGYDVYYRQQRGHQIGIQFFYTSPKEVMEKREELIRFTGEKGIFVKKN